MSFRTTAVLSGLTLAATACTWVEPTDAGAAVRVASIGDVASCQRLGTAGSNTLEKVGPVSRNDAKVAMELETLARNQAAAMGGDTIVALAVAPDAGAGSYAVFRCTAAD